MAPHQAKPLPHRIRLLPNRRAAALVVKGQLFPQWAASVLVELPPLLGAPLHLDIQPFLTSCGGRLLSNQPHRGHAIFAASFIRKREIVLEKELLSQSGTLTGIFLHELFHFAWVRAGNEVRRNYAALLREEVNRGARAEVGESSDVSKRKLDGAEDVAAWKHYVCESFCDTAAWYFSPNDLSAVVQPSLARCWRRKRADWFREWTSRLNVGVRL